MMHQDSHVIHSPFRDVDVPQIDMWSFIKEALESHGNHTAILRSESCDHITCTQLLNASHHVATSFQSRGLHTNHPVMLFMRTSLEFILTCLAVWRLGGHLVCVNPLLTSGEMISVLKLVSCDLIVCDDGNAKVVQDALTGLGLQKIVVSRTCVASHLSFADPSNSALDFVKPQRKPVPSDMAVILLSSGTTGKCKAVEISHRALVGQTLMWSSPELGNLPRGVSILYQPLSHSYGFTLMIIKLTMGVPVVLMETFALKTFIDHMLEYKPDQLYLVPPIAVLLCKNEMLRNHDLTFVKSISSGAAPLGEDLCVQLQQVFSPNVVIRQLFGLTEGTGGCLGIPYSTKSKKCPTGSIGWPFPNVKAKIVAISDGSSLGPHEMGEMCLKCEFFMTAYLGNPEATEEAIDANGWLHTGDLAYYDESGCFFIVDRLKELIKVKGYQVAPAELESILLSHSEVKDAGVTGIPHSIWGEVPSAWVVKQPESQLTEWELAQFVNKQVASFKQLQGGIAFVEQIPKSASGKILRREIKERIMMKSVISKL